MTINKTDDMTLNMLREKVNLRGKKVTVMGLGLFGGGVGVSRFLSSKGADVTVTDLKDEQTLHKSIEALSDCGNITFHLGGHLEKDFAETDMVIVNPAVPPDSPYLQVAVVSGVALESEMNLFFKFCRAKKIGVTGSNGKTTTATLISEVLKADFVRRKSSKKVWLGGNIGRPLIELVNEIAPEDVVVLEISSFQLEHLGAIKMSPEVSIVTNIHPNHLDRHKTMENYINAKKNIILHQKHGNYAILNADDPVLANWTAYEGVGRCWFSRKNQVAQGAFLAAGDIIAAVNGRKEKIGNVDNAMLPGGFNRENMLAAAVCGMIFGVDNETIIGVLTGFPGVEHRLEFAGEFGGVRYYNDSIGTDPSASEAAVRALKGNIILIAGGREKKLPFDDFIDAVTKHVKTVVLVGECAGKIESLINNYAAASKPRILHAGYSMEKAVELAKSGAKPGDIVLLSPACTSYDMFNNFIERGDAFKRLIKR